MTELHIINRPALFAAALIASAASHALAGPPVQWRVPLPGAWQPLDAAMGASGSQISGKLNDSGELVVRMSSADGTTLAVGVDESFQIVRPWVGAADATNPDTSQPGSWRVLGQGVQHTEDGRLVFLAENTSTGSSVVSLRELAEAGGVWAEREIARDEPGVRTIGTGDFRGRPSIDSNNAGETVWFETTPDSGRIMIDRGTGAGAELYLSEDDAVVPQAGGGLISQSIRLFDDGTVLYGVWDFTGYYAVRRGPLPGSTTFQEYINTDASEECGVWGSDRGDLLTGHYRLNWQPAGPSPMAPFEIDAEDGGFAGFGAFPHGAVSNDGRFVVQAGIPWTGITGLYVGPDAANDEIVREGDVILGQVLDGLTLLDLNTRGELLCTYLREVEYSGQTYKLATPLLGTICPADMSRDGVFDNGDIGGFITGYLDGSMRTDFNNDGLLDNGDIGEFITQFLAGC